MCQSRIHFQRFDNLFQLISDKQYLLFLSEKNFLLSSIVDEENRVCRVDVVEKDDHENASQFSLCFSKQSLDRFDTADGYSQCDVVILFDRMNEDRWFDYS